MTPPNIFSTNDDRLVGKWVSKLNGPSISELEPVATADRMELWLYEDGAARWGYPEKPKCFEEDPTEAPTRTGWSVDEGRTLIISSPAPPIPEYEIYEWQEAHSIYDIMQLDYDQLTLSDRPFDGEIITHFVKYADC
ncbi:hypothetical protein SAMN02745181_3209 [Rubritalea squalenifaciens DSM 18772]|uniref:Uncharacterized protein n=1 Tax=Rubritalea squalenifaciens DSM 18772 TaxID=1123071 RepID=A0A1M6PJG2_9BACT|nr:hypothetical protein [Rubritalea squalenifaciens]SHK08077.1 hypothetical protein SAMN02745181_3209 [Rubritalea squalenifaciens DSM 18772]